MQTVIYFILVPMVYIAVAVFVLGTLVRLINIFRQPQNPSTLQIYPEKRPAWFWAIWDTLTFPTVLRHNPLHWLFLMLFHVCLLLLVIGHLELIQEFQVLQIVEHEVFIGKGFVGVILVLCLLFFLFRRFISPYRDLSVPEDYYLLILLFLAVIFGSEMDWARSWYGYEEMGVDDYREYLYSLITLQPELPYGATFSGHSFMLVLHVLFANLFLMVAPFTKIMHSFLSLPMNKLRRG